MAKQKLIAKIKSINNLTALAQLFEIIQLLKQNQAKTETILRAVTICAFLNPLTPSLSRRERGTKSAIRARVEYSSLLLQFAGCLDDADVQQIRGKSCTNI